MPNDNIARLAHLGFARALFDDVVTSGEVAWHGIGDQSFGVPFVPGRSMFVLGHEDHDYGFEKLGVRTVDDPSAADFILIAASLAPKTSLQEYGRLLADAATAGIPALCCNPDRFMLTPQGVQPSAGEIASVYRDMGGKVTFVGKPYPAMYAFAKTRLGLRDFSRILAIGDSVEHDIRGAFDAQLHSALVRTGLCDHSTDDELNMRFSSCAVTPDFVLPRLAW